MTGKRRRPYVLGRSNNNNRVRRILCPPQECRTATTRCTSRKPGTGVRKTTRTTPNWFRSWSTCGRRSRRRGTYATGWRRRPPKNTRPPNTNLIAPPYRRRLLSFQNPERGQRDRVAASVRQSGRPAEIGSDHADANVRSRWTIGPGESHVLEHATADGVHHPVGGRCRKPHGTVNGRLVPFGWYGDGRPQCVHQRRPTTAERT